MRELPILMIGQRIAHRRQGGRGASLLHGECLAPALKLRSLLSLAFVGKIRRHPIAERLRFGVRLQIGPAVIDEPSPVPLFVLTRNGKRHDGHPQISDWHGQRHA